MPPPHPPQTKSVVPATSTCHDQRCVVRCDFHPRQFIRNPRDVPVTRDKGTLNRDDDDAPGTTPTKTGLKNYICVF